MSVNITLWPSTGEHPAINALWSLFDSQPDIFGGSIENYDRARGAFERIAAGGHLDSGTIAEVLAKLNTLSTKPVQSPVPREILTRTEAMEYLRVRSDRLHELTAPAGVIPCIRHGSRVHYRLEDLRQFVASKVQE